MLELTSYLFANPLQCHCCQVFFWQYVTNSVSLTSLPSETSCAHDACKNKLASIRLSFRDPAIVTEQLSRPFICIDQAAIEQIDQGCPEGAI